MEAEQKPDPHWPFASLNVAQVGQQAVHNAEHGL
jgi:hypothetical protein